MYILRAVVYSQDLYHPVLIGHQTPLLLYVIHHVCDLQAEKKKKQCHIKFYTMVAISNSYHFMFILGGHKVQCGRGNLKNDHHNSKKSVLQEIEFSNQKTQTIICPSTNFVFRTMVLFFVS